MRRMAERSPYREVLGYPIWHLGLRGQPENWWIFPVDRGNCGKSGTERTDRSVPCFCPLRVDIEFHLEYDFASCLKRREGRHGLMESLEYGLLRISLARNFDLKPIWLTIELDEHESRRVVLRKDRVCPVLGRLDERSEVFDTDSLLQVWLACEQTNAIGDNWLSSGVAFSFRFVGLELAFRNVSAMINRIVIAGFAVRGFHGQLFLISVAGK